MELSVRFWQTRKFAVLCGFVLGLLCFYSFSVLKSNLIFKITKMSKVEKQNQMAMPFPRSEDWDPMLDDFFNDQMTDSNADPFESLKQMREQMMKKGHPFDSWYQRKFGGGMPGEIKKSETEKSVIYEISIKGLDKQSFSVEVRDQQIELKGKVEIKNENGGASVQSFQRTFPVPRGVDAKKVEIESDAEKIVLRFPKVRGE